MCCCCLTLSAISLQHRVCICTSHTVAATHLLTSNIPQSQELVLDTLAMAGYLDHGVGTGTGVQQIYSRMTSQGEGIVA